MRLRRLVILIGFLSLILSSVGFLMGEARPLGNVMWFSMTENFVHVGIGIALFGAGLSVPEGNQKYVVTAFALTALAYGVATAALFAASGRLLTSPADIVLHFVVGFGALAIAFNARRQYSVSTP